MNAFIRFERLFKPISKKRTYRIHALIDGKIRVLHFVSQHVQSVLDFVLSSFIFFFL